MASDLHMHTTFSDGKLTPEELVAALLHSTLKEKLRLLHLGHCQSPFLLSRGFLGILELFFFELVLLLPEFFKFPFGSL